MKINNCSKDNSKNLFEYFFPTDCDNDMGGYCKNDGTDNFMTTFATLISDNTLFTVTSDINSGNVRLLITPTTSNSLTYRFIAEKHLI